MNGLLEKSTGLYFPFQNSFINDLKQTRDDDIPEILNSEKKTESPDHQLNLVIQQDTNNQLLI